MLWFQPKYKKVRIHGQRNPAARIARLGRRRMFLRLTKRKIKQPTKSPRHSPPPLDCSTRVVSAASDPVAKAQKDFCDSHKRTAAYTVRHDSKVAYQLCRTRKR